MASTQEERAKYEALAEMEGLCPDTSLQGTISDAEALASDRKQIVGYHLLGCRCGGTGRIALFKELRVACLGCRECQPKNTQYFRNTARQNICQGRGWVPEPDVEKACWRILHALYHLTKAHNISHMDFGPSSYPFVKRGETDLIAFTQGAYVQGEWDEKDIVKGYGKSFEEAVISAAEAWAKEQQKEAQHEP